MEINNDKVVSITYELRKDKENGEVVEQVTTENPLTFIYGAGGMLPKFEQHLSGLKVGDDFNFGLISDDAYGASVENAIVDVPMDVFKVEGEIDNNLLSLGNMVPMMDNSGNRLNGLITEIKESTVTMDFNHPMAGKDLFFKGKVTDIRQATEEELSHGHLHGANGCGDGSCGDNEGGCACGH